ncbi:MAG TPA: NPCBM/NEW2 domain-containing protein [Thermoanaerobaculaceae bacterium]|mgnify:CR=1 FL=1|nr:NPCBM/NEW2 domain-containing protein [Thermoanaerobaculaceae bacterium]
MGARRRTLVLSILLPLTVAAVAWLFLVTYGTWNLVGEEWLSATYDSLARSLVRGEATVDPDAIWWEGIKVGDKVVAYHAPFPALLRIVPGMLFPEMYAKWSRVSCWLAALLAGLAFSVMISRAAGRNASLSGRGRNWLVAWSIAGFGLASPVVYLISSARLYHEPILWGLAWSLTGAWLVWELLASDSASAWALVGLAASAAAGLLSRLVSGAPLVVVWTFMAVWCWHGRKRGEGGGDGRRRLTPYIAGVVIIGLAVGLTGWYNQARFGSIWKVFDYKGFYFDPASVGGEFNVRRLASGIVNYFGFSTSYFAPESPFIRMAPSLYLDPAVFFKWREEAISLTFAASWLVAGALLGIVAMGKGRRWAEAAACLPLAIQAVFILGFYFITERYQGELMPWLVFCYVAFAVHWRFDRQAGRLFLRSLPLLVGVSAMASVASTLDFHLRLCGDTPISYKRDLIHWLRPGPEFGPWKGHRLLLSDLAPVSTTFSFEKMGTDISFDGKILDVQGRLLARGLGMHAVSTAVYKVPAGSSAIEALVGQPKVCQGSRGSVTFEVLDQDGTVLYGSGVIRGSDPGRTFRVTVEGVREVTLRLGDAGDGIDSDHGVWGEVAFLIR